MRSLQDSARKSLYYSGFLLSGSFFAMSYLLAQLGHDVAIHEIFWAGVALVVLSTCAILLTGRPAKAECLALSALIGATFYLPKLFRSPQFFNFHDELAHWRATEELLSGGGLFLENPLNRVVEFYPGLHAATAVLAASTGLSTFVAGNILIAAAHVLLAATLFLIFELTLGSPRAGVIATLVYAANPAFFFFDAQFAYESLALPLVAAVLLLGMTTKGFTGTHGFLAWALASVLSLAVVITHHISSYVLVLVLVALAISSAVAKKKVSDHSTKHFTVLAFTAACLTLVWLLGVANYTLDYLGPIVRDNLGAPERFLRGESAPRTLFAGATIPSYEVWGSYGSVIILALAFTVGILLVLRTRILRERYAFMTMTAVGSVYFLSLPLVWLLSDQAAKRTWEFSFIGLSVFGGLAFARPLFTGGLRLRSAVLLAMLVLFVGGVVTRSGEHIRFPGPYEASADPRSMTDDVISAAAWFKEEEGSGHTIMGDRTISIVFGSYGHQNPATYQFYGIRPWDVFLPETLTPEVFAELHRSGTEYVIVDMRISEYLPRIGFYFNESEDGAYQWTEPLSRLSLVKFASKEFARIYDNGNIKVYKYLGDR